MMFRDGQRGTFPRSHIKDDQVDHARMRDRQKKLERQIIINSSKYVRQSELKEGDLVYMRNHTRTHKFDPLFAPRILKVCENDSGIVTVVDELGHQYKRHPDDLRVAMVRRGDNFMT